MADKAAHESEMKVLARKADPALLEADLVACFACEGDVAPRGVQDAILRRELAAEMKAERFAGRMGDALVWNADGRFPSRRFLVFGLGPPERLSLETLHEGCARLIQKAERLGAARLGVGLPALEDASPAEAVRAAAEGLHLGAYRFERYLTDARRRRAEVAVVELATSQGSPAALRGAVERATWTSRAVALARDLVNEPPSRMNPLRLARRAQELARQAGIQARVLGPQALRRLGAEAILAVAAGSAHPAQVVHLTYRPSARKPRRRVVLVGKGVTFDSGGLNLKPGSGMLTMKGDMAGAAAVIAVMGALPEAGCRDEVHGLVGIVENMTGPRAFKPGDILRTLSGKTVEVDNTDAEGRLVLCDLLAYAVRQLKPQAIVDLATLTGACVVALGPRCAGVFSRHDKLRQEILEAGRRAGEMLWPLPMVENYLEQLQQGPADLKNVGGRWGGAILAALFLGEFVPREMPWVHLDIAGPAFQENETPPWPVGGTGAGVRTLLRWLER